MDRLIPIDQMPPIPGIQIPKDFYWVLSEPAPLGGMRFPRDSTPWTSIHQAGFQHVINLSEDSFSYHPDPLNPAIAIALKDLINGKSPADPRGEENKIREAVSVALSVLWSGEGVVLHCYGGRGRTGTVIGCILVSLGYDATPVVDYLDRLHQARGKGGWPEAEWQRDLVKRFIII